MTTRRALLRSAPLLPAGVALAAAQQREEEKDAVLPHQVFAGRHGADGFEKSVQRVAELESTIGIADLAQFTPR